MSHLREGGGVREFTLSPQFILFDPKELVDAHPHWGGVHALLSFPV